MNYELKRQKSGAYSVYHPQSGETMHPMHGPWAEANGLYVAGSRLDQRLSGQSGPGAPPDVVVFDVGLGGAANALAAVSCHQNRVRQGLSTKPLRLISFEHDPQTLRFTLEEADQLGYPRGYEENLRQLLDKGQTSLPGGLKWELRLGDFLRLIEEEPARADVVFFDPYSPKANPEMWRLSVFESLYGCRRPGEGQVLLTYSSAFSTRAALLLAGYFVGDAPQLNPKSRTTIGATSPADLEVPLNRGWLGRWRQEKLPWPPDTLPGDYKRLRGALLDHPQWAEAMAREGNPPAGEAKAARAQGARKRLTTAPGGDKGRNKRNTPRKKPGQFPKSKGRNA